MHVQQSAPAYRIVTSADVRELIDRSRTVRERAVDVSVQAAEAMRRAEDIRCRATLVADAVERLRLDLRPSRRATPEHVTSIPGS